MRIPWHPHPRFSHQPSSSPQPSPSLFTSTLILTPTLTLTFHLKAMKSHEDTLVTVREEASEKLLAVVTATKVRVLRSTSSLPHLGPPPTPPLPPPPTLPLSPPPTPPPPPPH